jgi:hypothetical protein
LRESVADPELLAILLADAPQLALAETVAPGRVNSTVIIRLPVKFPVELLKLSLRKNVTRSLPVGPVVEIPAWVTQKSPSLMKKHPVRELVLVLGATKYLTWPSPKLPSRPGDMIVIKFSLFITSQKQSFDAVTLTLPSPPLAGKDALVGKKETGQKRPSCVTVNVCPAMVSVPVRINVTVLAATK